MILGGIKPDFDDWYKVTEVRLERVISANSKNRPKVVVFKGKRGNFWSTWGKEEEEIRYIFKSEPLLEDKFVMTVAKEANSIWASSLGGIRSYPHIVTQHHLLSNAEYPKRATLEQPKICPCEHCKSCEKALAEKEAVRKKWDAEVSQLEDAYANECAEYERKKKEVSVKNQLVQMAIYDVHPTLTAGPNMRQCGYIQFLDGVHSLLIMDGKPNLLPVGEKLTTEYISTLAGALTVTAILSIMV